MAINFSEVGTISNGSPQFIPTSLQFGPDGKLYATTLLGQVFAITVEKDQQSGTYSATNFEEITLPGGIAAVQSIQNHDDDGSVNNSETNRLITGLVVAGTASNPVLYVSSADPRRSQGPDTNLDTNSGVITRLTWTGSQWDAVDIIRGLPRSEESHSINGLELSADGSKLYLAVGGNTNNGAPSEAFAYTAEYALSAAVLEIDLNSINSKPVLTDPNGGQNGTSRQYIYDLPTLDDPNTANDGVREDVNGLDVSGPWGGRDGLNQAILPADAPLRIYADGLRNNYDLELTANGLFTVDNGSNVNVGGAPVDSNGVTTGTNGAGEATNTPVETGSGDDEPIFLLEDGGYYGHANPTRSNQNLEWIVYDDTGNPDTSLSVFSVPDISALVPNGVNIQSGFLIDPSKFTSDPTRLEQSGIRVQRRNSGSDPDVNPLFNLGSAFASTNGSVEYNANSFDGALQGGVFVVDLSGSVTFININDNGTGLDPVIDPGADGQLGTGDDVTLSADGVYTVFTGPAAPLDITVGPDGTLWIAELFGNKITVFEPSDTPVDDDDFDNDGILDKDDRFIRDASNGRNVALNPGQNLIWDFDENLDGNLPGPGGYATGLTGVLVNGVTDYQETLNLGNVKFATASGGGTTVIENVANGDPLTNSNDGEFLFHTGLTINPDVETFTIKWNVVNPAGDPGTTFPSPDQQIGGYLGTGDQFNYLKIVATGDANGEVQILLEDNDVVQSSTFIQADDLFTGISINQTITFELEINPTTGSATPTVTYENSTGIQTVTGNAIDLTGSQVLEVINGNYTQPGDSGPTGLAVGLFSSNTGQSSANTFAATFQDIEITASALPALTLSIDPSSLSEDGGTALATLTRDGDLSAPLTVTLTSSDTSEATVPLTVDIPANQASATFQVTAVDDTIVDGTTTTTITAAANGYTNGTDTIDILDNDILTSADLQLTKVVDNETPNVGENITFTLTIENTGPDDATSVSVSDLLPSGLSYVSHTSSIGSYDSSSGIWDLGAIADGTSETLTLTATVLQPVASAAVLYRVNVGGQELQAADGSALVWSEDTNTNPSPFRVSGQNGIFTKNNGPITLNSTVSASAPTDLFRSQRFDGPSFPQMEWEFAVDPGSELEVRLYFAEIAPSNIISGAGERVFDIAIEGAVPAAFDDIDPFAIAGDSNIGFMLSQNIIVNDGALNLEFINGIENPSLQGIEIVQAGGTEYDNYAEILTSDQFDLDSTPGNSSNGEDDDATIVITPNPVDALSVSVTPMSISENGGTATVTVTRNTDTTNPLTVTLTSSDTTEVTVPDTVEIPAGETSISFQVSAVDDLIMDGTQAPTLTASAPNLLSGTATIQITDDEVGAALSLLIANTDILENGGSTTATVTRNTDTTDPLTVILTSSDPTEATVPQTVVIPAGATSVSFDIAAVDDLDVDGTQTPIITASASGFIEAQATVNVLDDEASSEADLSLAKTVSNLTPAVGDNITFTLTVNNDGPSPSTGILVEDLLASGFIYVSDNGAGAYNATTGIWDVGNLTIGASASLEITATVEEVGPVVGPAALYRVNVGGLELAPTDGSTLVWSEDTNTNPSPFRVAGQNGTFTKNNGTITTDSSVPNGVPTDLFRSQRFDGSPFPEMQWEFAVDPGTEVEVRLYFAEIAPTSSISGPGERVFDVSLEGAVPAAFDDIDPFAIAGGSLAGFMLSETLVINDGSVSLEFLHGIENPAIQGIEIVEVGSGSSDPAPYSNYAQILSADQTDIDSTPGDGSIGDDDDATVTITPTTGGGPTPEASLSILSGVNAINASTFNKNSFAVTNQSTGDIKIEKVVLNVSSSLLPKIVFDPTGSAGDVVAKGLVVDSGSTETGFQTPANNQVDPFSIPIGNGGYHEVELNFTDFNPGETASFSVDLDPTNIEGDNGAGSEGAISGSELIGSIATIYFSDGSVLEGQLFSDGSVSGSETLINETSAPGVSLDILNVSLVPDANGFFNKTAEVADTQQTVLITGQPGQTVKLFIAETSGEPGEVDGVPITTLQPFEVNTIVQATDQTVTLDNNGEATVVVTLNQSANPIKDILGVNLITAAPVDASGTVSGPVTAPIALQLVEQGLSLTLDATSVSEGSMVNATVSRNTASNESLVVSLNSSDETEATVPDTITIPAGQTSATFQINAADDILTDGDQLPAITASAFGFTDAVATLTVTDNDTIADGSFLFTVNQNTNFGEVTATPQDIVLFDGSNFSLFFDGSDVGITSVKINAFDVISNSEILLSFDNPIDLPDIGPTDDSDVVKFTGTSFADNTVGSFSKFIDGSDLGLDSGGEDIDALLALDDGTVLFSTTGNVNLGNGVIATDEDVLLFTPTQLGNLTTGSLTVFIDGSDINLADYDIDALALNSSGEFVFSLDATFALPGLAGENEDAFTFLATSTGDDTSGAFGSNLLFDGSQFGLSFRDIQGLDFTFLGVDATPRLSLDLTPISISENGGTATVTLTRTGDLSAELTVNLSSSDASEATVPTTAVIPAGEASTTFQITAIDELIIDGDQAVAISASADGLTSGFATLTVIDDDGGNSLSLSIDPSSISEKGGAATATISRSGDTTAALTVNLASSDTSEATVPSTVIIPAGATSTTFEITGVDDAVVDGTQAPTITASAAGFTGAIASINITDDDAPKLTLAIDSTSISENGGLATATVTRTGDLSSPLTVNVSSSDTSEATVPDTIEIPANQDSVTFQVTGVDDGNVDGTQNITITANATGLESGTATLNITDDDGATPGSFLLTLNSSINLNGVATTPQDILLFDGTNYSLYLDGSDVGIEGAEVNAFDVISPTEVLLSFDNPIVLPGLGEVDDSDVVKFTATSLGENSAGTFSLYFDGSDVGLSNGGEDIVGITQLNNGNLLLAINGKLNPGSGVIAENEDIVLFTPTSLGDNTAGDFSLFFDGSDVGLEPVAIDGFSLDTQGNLYLASTNDFTIGSLTGENEDVFIFSPTTTGENTNGTLASDLFFDGSEFGLNFKSIQGIDLTFSDAAPPETLNLSLDSSEISEDGGTTTVTVTRTGDTSAALTVSLISDDTGEATVPASVEIPAGQSFTTFQVVGIDDLDLDGTQTATLTASAPGLTDGITTIDVIDNEVAPSELTLSLDASTISENGGSTTATVTRTGDTSTAVTVNLMSSDTTEISVPQTIEFEASQTTATFQVTGVDDTDTDGTQTSTITASANGFSDATININTTDDDGTSGLSINDITVDETAQTATFTVSLSGNSGGPVTVDYSTSDGTAQNQGSAFLRNDYFSTSGSLTFGQNELSQSITVDLRDDLAIEGDETFTVNLSNPSGATISDGTGVATIIENDGTQLSNNLISYDFTGSTSQAESFSIMPNAGGTTLGVTATASEEGILKDVFRSGKGFGVAGEADGSFNDEIDGKGPGGANDGSGGIEELLLTFDAPVKLEVVTFKSSNSDDDFVIQADGLELISGVSATSPKFLPLDVSSLNGEGTQFTFTVLSDTGSDDYALAGVQVSPVL